MIFKAASGNWLNLFFSHIVRYYQREKWSDLWWKRKCNAYVQQEINFLLIENCPYFFAFFKRFCFPFQKAKLILHIKITSTVLQPPCPIWPIKIHHITHVPNLTSTAKTVTIDFQNTCFADTKATLFYLLGTLV